MKQNQTLNRQIIKQGAIQQGDYNSAELDCF